MAKALCRDGGPHHCASTCRLDFIYTKKLKIPAVAVNRDTRAKSATSPPIALAAVTDVDEPPTVAGTRLGLSAVG